MSSGTTRATPLAPLPPASVTLKDVSDTNKVNVYVFSIQWEAVENPSLEYYILERSTDGVSYSTLTTTSERTYRDETVNGSTTYYYRLKSHTGPAPDVLVEDSVVSQTVSGKPGSAPVASNIVNTTAGTSSVTITWTTDLASDSVVEYGPTNSFGYSAGNISASETSHSVVLSGLSPNTAYYYRIRSKGAGDVITTSANRNFSTQAEVQPTISGISSGTPGVTTATITWTTDIDSDSYIEYGTTTSYGNLKGSSTLTTSHSVTLVGLSMFSTYHFRVKSQAAEGIVKVSDDYTLITSLSVAEATLSISDVASLVGNSSTVAITWDTPALATSQVSYGVTESLGTSTAEDTVLTMKHYTLLSNLTPSTTYYYQAVSRDSQGDMVRSDVESFTTQASVDTSAPAISSVKITDITLTSAIISWKTNVVTTSTVNIGPTDQYGTAIDDQSAGSTTIHTIRLSDLTQGTEYHFRIKGKDQSNNAIASDDYTFETLTMPVISDIIVKDITERTATITWNTNTGTDSFIDFAKYTDTTMDKSQGRVEEVENHAITIVGLDPATVYQFKIKSRDIYGNTAQSASYTFITIIDTTPPIIKDLKSETSILTDVNGEARSQAIISWSTDEPATSQIQYSMGIAAKEGYQFSTEENTSLSISHITVISNLIPAANYHLRVIAKDAAGNIGYSDDYTILTLKQETTLLQYIIQILEERFGWVKNLGIKY